MTFRCEVQPRSEGTWVSLGGSINESCSEALTRLATSLPTGTCVFNLRDIPLVNSIGASYWIKFIKAIGSGRALIFEECSPAVVAQLNMSPSFRGAAEVRSVCAPYSCANCDYQDLHLLVKGVNLPDPGERVEARVCPKCGSELAIEVFEMKFFKFNQNNKASKPPE